MVGFGGVIRDDSGRWVKGYYGFISYTNSITAKLWSIREGLRLMAQSGSPKLIVESDCEVTINLLNKLEEIDSAYEAILEDCRLYAASFEVCEFIHTLREGNTCVDYAANLGVNQRERMVVMDEPPTELLRLLFADVASMAYFRPS
uniref:RNase H type-1 domain-containing protein n=1 Tax=Davidia involucrata TaxID=16924 RepID=A0A5B7ALD5_DAVIN